MNSSEDFICLIVSALACPPAFDNPIVISKYFETWDCVHLLLDFKGGVAGTYMGYVAE